MRYNGDLENFQYGPVLRSRYRSPQPAMLDQCLPSLFGLLHCLLRALDLEGSCQSIPANINGVRRDPNPERVEEDQVHPQVHKIAAVQPLVSGQPLRGKRHESYDAALSA